MVQVILLTAFLLIAVVSLLTLAINGLLLLIRRKKETEKKPALRRAKRNMIVLITAVLLCAGLVLLSQLTASTPKIRDSGGQEIPGSIAELRQVELNGREEWISLRGQDKSKPVLLFLAGGPGGTQMAAVHHEQAALEQYFVVVNWDQAGSGKSYGAVPSADISLETYVEDGLALTRYLCDAFGQEKIYLVGESWGSALGIFLADRSPELYHAVIGTGQMVAFLDTETENYSRALSLAESRNNTETVKTLLENGPPPYEGNGAMKIMAYTGYLGSEMTANPDIHNAGYRTFRDIFSEEYGLLDKINFFYALYQTFGEFYPQLYTVDLRRDYAKLDVPVYFFLGRHDINAPTVFAEEYAALLQAPEKEIVWFEHSGHSPWINESERFTEELLRVTGAG